MTREEKAKILDYAIERAYREVEAATGAEMDSTEFHNLLESLTEMEWMLDRFQDDREETPVGLERPEAPAPVVVEAVKPVEPEKPAEPAPDGPQYKMEEVRAALAKARGKGVNVSEIIRSFGVDSFPQIDKSRYHEVMKKLEDATT